MFMHIQKKMYVNKETKGGLCCQKFVIFIILRWIVKNIDVVWYMYRFIEKLIVVAFPKLIQQ